MRQSVTDLLVLCCDVPNEVFLEWDVSRQLPQLGL